MLVQLVAKLFCNNKNENLTEKLQANVESLLRNHFTLTREKTLVYVGLTERGHGLIFMEFINLQTGLHELHTVELTKEVRGNNASGASSGDPVYIGTREVTEDGFTSVNLCSKPFVLDMKQKKRFLRK